jgi:hypothetical protein
MQVPSEIVGKWQEIVNLLAEIMGWSGKSVGESHVFER